MGKIKIRKVLSRESIRTAFIIYTFGCLSAALLTSLLLSGLCQMGQSMIFKKYASDFDSTRLEVALDFYENQDSLKADSPDRLGIQYHTQSPTVQFTPLENTIYSILNVLSAAVFPLCFAAFIVITGALFYKRQMQRPLELLDHAADRIADNDLDFRVTWNGSNELGRLCASFEKMRAALQDNNMEMWRQVEERKRLNAAFSHDLRTPLTVLKGQSEMLAKYAPQMSEEKIISSAEMMRRHIMRLEDYVTAMSELQRLEDISVTQTAVEPDDLVIQLQSTGKCLCREKQFTFSCPDGKHGLLWLDLSVVLRVYENLLSNAVRFAAENVWVSLEYGDEYLCLSVSDDGDGFTQKDLANAVKPFYKAADDTEGGHLGMGLNICKILCEKHGGFLRLENPGGGMVTAAFRQKVSACAVGRSKEHST